MIRAKNVKKSLIGLGILMLLGSYKIIWDNYELIKEKGTGLE